MAKKFWYLIRSHQAIRDKSWKANKSICIEYQTQYTIIFDGAYEMVVGEREEEKCIEPKFIASLLTELLPNNLLPLLRVQRLVW